MAESWLARQRSTAGDAFIHISEAGRRRPIPMSAELHRTKVLVSSTCRPWRERLVPWTPAHAQAEYA